MLRWFVTSGFHFILVWKRLFRRSGKHGKLREFHFAKFVDTLTYLGNSGLCWTVFARKKTLSCLQKEMATYRHWSVSLWRDPDDVSHCRILSRQNWMAAYLGYTQRMRMLFRGWPIMVHDTHTRRRRRSDSGLFAVSSLSTWSWVTTTYHVGQKLWEKIIEIDGDILKMWAKQCGGPIFVTHPVDVHLKPVQRESRGRKYNTVTHTLHLSNF